MACLNPPEVPVGSTVEVLDYPTGPTPVGDFVAYTCVNMGRFDSAPDSPALEVTCEERNTWSHEPPWPDCVESELFHFKLIITVI